MKQMNWSGKVWGLKAWLIIDLHADREIAKKIMVKDYIEKGRSANNESI